MVSKLIINLNYFIMNKAIVFYSNGKPEKFDTDDFNIIIADNPRKSEIINIQITKTILEDKTRILFEAFMQNDLTDVNFFKAWPVKVVNDKFKFLKVNDPVANLSGDELEKKLCVKFEEFINSYNAEIVA